MLRLMLDSHPSLAIPGEGHFIPYARKRLRRFTSPGGLDGAGLARTIVRGVHFQRWNIPSEFVLDHVCALKNPSFADVIEAFYVSYAKFHDKVRWGDKTPLYVRFIPMLADLFPSARFIHVIRDGRAVALSYMSIPWGPSTVWEAAAKWRADVTAGRRAGGPLGRDRYCEVRYEDLVADPHLELRKICDFSALEFDEAMLSYHQDALRRLQCGPHATDWHRSAAAPPTQGLRDWRSQMKPADVEAFEAVAGDELSQLGYERRLPDVSRYKRIEVFTRARAIDLKIAGSKVKKRALQQWPVGRSASTDRRTG
jgi:hypothetical protein